MVSRRNYFTITLIMLVVFFMFQVPEILKDKVNHYEHNEFAGKTAARYLKSSVVTTDEETALKTERFVVYIGDFGDDGLGSVVNEWCRYGKYYVRVYDSLSKCTFHKDRLPYAVLVDSDYMDVEKDTSVFRSLADLGVNMIFCSLPDADTMTGEEYEGFRTLLGIRYIRQTEVRVEGIRLLDGFLLGGKKEYQLAGNMEKTQQDLDLDVPWYGVSSRTKVYMVGMIDQEGKNVSETDKALEGATYMARLPALIWRSNVSGSDIFAVNGDYMQDQAGLGILSAMMSEMKSYDLYPVVNAQNFVVLNFPDLASENDQTMMEMYSQDLKSVYRDIVWPGLVSVAQQNGFRMTCMFLPQMEYTDRIRPDDELLVYYMKRIQEQGAEAGLSGTYEGVDLEEKTKQDITFIRGILPDYTILSFYKGNLAGEGLKTVLTKNVMLDDLHTVFTDYNSKEPLLSYYSANVLKQSVTNDGYTHTFSEDLRMNSIETALGYTAIGVDVNPVGFPEGVEDSWEKLSEKFASNSSTYWKKYKAFAQTTLAESDIRVRRFLALSYHQSRIKNRIYLTLDHFDQEAYFILRTHDEEIDLVDGGTFEKIEDNAYLISATDSSLVIQLKEKEPLYYTYEAEKEIKKEPTREPVKEKKKEEKNKEEEGKRTE